MEKKGLINLQITNLIECVWSKGCR